SPPSRPPTKASRKRSRADAAEPAERSRLDVDVVVRRTIGLIARRRLVGVGLAIAVLLIFVAWGRAIGQFFVGVAGLGRAIELVDALLGLRELGLRVIDGLVTRPADLLSRVGGLRETG